MPNGDEMHAWVILASPMRPRSNPSPRVLAKKAASCPTCKLIYLLYLERGYNIIHLC